METTEDYRLLRSEGISENMIGVGIETLIAHYDPEQSNEREAVIEIFRAMKAATPH